MKKSTIITAVSVVAIVAMLLILFSIKDAKAVQETITETPTIAEFESRSSEWGKHYPRQYGSYLQTHESNEILDVLEENPALVVMWAGYGFSKDYNAPRGHYYALEDNMNTLRTGAPVRRVFMLSSRA